MALPVPELPWVFVWARVEALSLGPLWQVPCTAASQLSWHPGGKVGLNQSLGRQLISLLAF